MSESKFVYVTYIRTTPEKLWRALTDARVHPPVLGRHLAGLRLGEGRVLEADDPRRPRRRRRRGRWRSIRRGGWCCPGENEFKPELKAEGFSRATFELEPQGDMVKLTVVHEIDKPGSKLIEAVSGGWPLILASLKSLLETGESLEATRKWPEGV